MNQLNIEMPEKLVDLLFNPARYKIMYGGRGSSKSWGCARALLTYGRAKREKILCAREIQKSIKESVHALLTRQIELVGMSDFYKITDTSIVGQNGTEFIFAGLKHNVDSIKSMEGITKAWVSEAHNVSKSSWDILIPTIREANSEIWADFNPRLETDETHQRFIINPPANARVVKMNWQDNPWFPDVLRVEMEALKAKNYEEYLNVWEGHCKQAVEGAVFKDELIAAQERIVDVPLVDSKPVDLIWDLGDSDGCAVWYHQQIGVQHRFIDHHYECHKKIKWHTDQIAAKRYTIGTIWLPHDADFELLGQEKTIKTQIKEAFPNAEVKIIEAAGKPGSVEQGINLARNIFGECWFDKKKCADGLQALRHWHYDKDEQSGKTSKKPVHDWSSHSSMAFVYFAMSNEEKVAPRKKKLHMAQSWMG